MAIATAFLGLAGSLVTATYAFVASHTQQAFEKQVKERELGLAELKEDHTIEKEYFLKAVDSENSPELRSRVLRYLTVSPRVSPEMKDWARSELVQVDVELKAEATALKGTIEEATKALDDTKARLAKLESERDAGAKKQLAKEQREQEAWLARLAVRAETSRAIAAAGVEVGKPATALACKPGSVRAVALGPDDPDQSTANGHCASSAAGREFDAKAKGHTSWLVRRAGRNFECECQLN